jgi:hypothetical protein
MKSPKLQTQQPAGKPSEQLVRVSGRLMNLNKPKNPPWLQQLQKASEVLDSMKSQPSTTTQT